jgi:hypothetical protein
LGAGYQDNNQDGSCMPNCDLAESEGLDCGDRGSCQDDVGIAECVCEQGYMGDTCEECSSNYQDNNNDGICLPRCTIAEINCNNHQECSDDAGIAECFCKVGYLGDDCSLCDVDNGYQDDDGNGDCYLTCAAIGYTCSGVVECSYDPVGQPTCNCPYGLDHDGNGNCVDLSGETCTSAKPLDLAESYVQGTTTGSGDQYSPSCVSSDSQEIVYSFVLSQDINVSFEVTGFDTVMYLRSVCASSSSEIDCNDDGGASSGSLIQASLTPGTYFLFIDGYGGSNGAYTLDIDVTCPGEQVFDAQSGLCIPDPCVTNPCLEEHKTVCEPVLPDDRICHCDPGYILNGEICELNPLAQGESCADAKMIIVEDGMLTASNGNSSNDDSGSCGGSGNDRVYFFEIEEAMRVEFSMTGYDTVLYLRSECDNRDAELMCNDDANGSYAGLTAFLDPGTYYLWADGNYGGSSYTLNYSFYPNPCNQPDLCPAVQECVASSDWSSYECVCPLGTLPYNDTCIDDPCDPNLCTQPYRNVCVPDLPDAHHCECNIGYIDDNGECIPDPSGKEWTFIVFLNADNNLESYGYYDLEEMAAAGSTDSVNIVALFDTYDGPANKIYVTQDGYDVIEPMGEIDMSDWSVMADFGVWAVQNYPARHYAFIMWDHGAGWKSAEPDKPLFKGFSNDDHGSNDEILISNGDYAQALAIITEEVGGKIDILGFDACLMGMWEVAEASAPYGNYLVASSETEPVDGWSYDDFLVPLVNDPTMSAEELGASIVDTYYAETTENSTQSLIDLNTMDDLASKMTSFANSLMSHTQMYSSFADAREDTQQYYYFDEYRDLTHFAMNISEIASIPRDLAGATNQLLVQLETTIVHSKAQTSHPNAYGLSIYFPDPNSYVESEYVDVGAVWSVRTTWDDFLSSFTQ